ADRHFTGVARAARLRNCGVHQNLMHCKPIIIVLDLCLCQPGGRSVNMLSLLAAAAITIAAENQKPGTADWEIATPALDSAIAGYASRTSVDGGEPIDLFVSTPAKRFAVDVFRMGWYGGLGARRVAGPIARDGIAQDAPASDPATGLIECRWRDPIRLDTRDA